MLERATDSDSGDRGLATEHLRFAPEILRRLGEELVPHPDLGVVELVRNAYDADAPSCKIRLQRVEEPGGTVIVEDEGDGMTVEELRSGWLLLGRSRKVREDAVSPLGRRRVGEKGLGRLAALRLGQRVRLSTRPRSNPGVEHVLVIDWDKFDGVEAVEDVSLTIETRPSDLKHGTSIEILNLRAGFMKQDVARLTRSLLLLVGPFPDLSPFPFSVNLDVPEFAQQEKIVHETFFDENEYLLAAVLDSSGQASARLIDWRGQEVATGSHHDIGSAGRSSRGRAAPLQYAGPSAEFELWMYNLSAESFNLRKSKRHFSDVRQWLRAVGGVHLYHRGLRVHPYGDDGHDWLDMNLRRARSPELRPSTNTSVGRVIVTDENNMLTAKTDRSGFVENMAFTELRMFCGDVLDWAAQQRLKLRENKRAEVKRKSRARVAEAKDNADKAIRSFPPPVRELAEQVKDELTTAYEERVQSLEDELQLYRTLGTVGTTTAVFAHESSRPLARIEQAAGIIDRRLRTKLAEEYARDLERHVSEVKASAASLRTFTDLPLGLVSRRKRKPRVVDLNSAIVELLEIFRPHLASAEVVIETELADSAPTVRTTVSAIEAIVANLLANAAYAFTVPRAEPIEDRTILIQTSISDHLVTISVFDNGPGIDTAKIALEDIWLPGNTTRENGTGLGLTIVRDVANDLGGSTYAKAVGELGGAEFHIELPRAQSQGTVP
jgi:signal transduction histidine kinase